MDDQIEDKFYQLLNQEKVEIHGNKDIKLHINKFSEALMNNTIVIILNIYNCELGDYEMKILLCGIKNNKSILVFHFGSNKIGFDGAKYIAERVKFKNITDLNLSKNQIGPSGIKFIAELIKESKSIVKVSLGWNQIGPIGAKFISEGIKLNSTITNLILNNNQIGPSGGKFIAEHDYLSL